jgi:hypothetical protein
VVSLLSEWSSPRRNASLEVLRYFDSSVAYSYVHESVEGLLFS